MWVSATTDCHGDNLCHLCDGPNLIFVMRYILYLSTHVTHLC